MDTGDHVDGVLDPAEFIDPHTGLCLANMLQWLHLQPEADSSALTLGAEHPHPSADTRQHGGNHPHR